MSSTHDTRSINLTRTFLLHLFADGREISDADLRALLGVAPGSAWDGSLLDVALNSLGADGSIQATQDGPQRYYRSAPAARSNVPSRTFVPTPEQAYGDPLLSAAWHMGLTEERVIDLLVKRNAERVGEMMQWAGASATPFRVVKGG